MPISSDNDQRPAQAAWRPARVSLSPTFRCWTCNQPRTTAGSVKRGPLKLQSCAQCVAKGAA